ncbi:MAG: 2-dehydropantoate 2-reductase [Clostridiales bacterium]|nr:2-dehydropantoate 2-reductase [Clostridiales bacterium]
MEIKNISLIGLGALGLLFGQQILKNGQNCHLNVIADQKRIDRYKKEGVLVNGAPLNFDYITPDATCEPADLIIVGVKANALNTAIQSIKNHVGKDTIILSMLNGIISEAVLGDAYGMSHMIYCVAQGMDAVKVGNQLTYDNMGLLCIGDWHADAPSDKVKAVEAFFKSVQIPYEIDLDMRHRIWGKFMLNVGVNQTVAVYEDTYQVVQEGGSGRDTMIAAMREVVDLSEKEGVGLTEADIDYWLKILQTLNPMGKPSMRQDLEAKRPSEVDLFSGTVIEKAKKYTLDTPVNARLYKEIKAMEAKF